VGIKDCNFEKRAALKIRNGWNIGGEHAVSNGSQAVSPSVGGTLPPAPGLFQALGSLEPALEVDGKVFFKRGTLALALPKAL